MASNSAGTDSQSFTIFVSEAASIISPPVTESLGSQVATNFGDPNLSGADGEEPRKTRLELTTHLGWEIDDNPSGSVGGLDIDCRKAVTMAKRLQQTATQPPLITSTPVTTGMVGSPYRYDVEATGNPTPTYSLTTASTATAVAYAQATATAAAATAAATGDSDGDGLSNAQEEIIGTDPFNPDTDADQLTDGQEVLIYATDPLFHDTDMDGFSDGQEVLVLGSDPLDPFDPVGSGPMPPGQKPPGYATPGPMPPWPRPPGTTQPGPPTRTPGPPPVSPTFTPLPTITLTPRVTPDPTDTATPTLTSEPTDTATPTLTAEPTETATPTLTPSPTATNTSSPLPSGSVVCVTTAPTIDGLFDPSEWPATPFAQFSAVSNPARQVEVYFVKNAGNLYLAYLINDPVNDPTDELRVLFDVLGNQGDPDAVDRFMRVNRDDAKEAWAGIGSNSDFQLWDSTYSSSDWTVAVSDSGSQWVVEIRIDATAEMPGLADPFGMMSQVQFTSAFATWPTGADGNNAGTWQAVNNPGCS